MSQSATRERGFTAIELLITLFVAAAFLIAGYQLFNVVVKDGGQARAESRAANVAYDYLRRYAPQTTNPCGTYSPLVNNPVTIDGLSNATISITVTCPAFTTTSVSKIEAVIRYNTPQQTLTYSTLTTGTLDDNVNGLVGWWKLNGDAIASAGGVDGAVVNAVPGNHDGIANRAMQFSGTNSYIQVQSVMGVTNLNATLTAWVYTPSSPSSGIILKVGNNASGFGMGVGNTNMENAGTNFILLYEGVRWIVTTGSITTGWKHVAMVINNGVPTAYVNGASVGTYAGSNPITPVGQTYMGGRASGNRMLTGNIDDARVYNRALSAGEISGIYTRGYK